MLSWKQAETTGIPVSWIWRERSRMTSGSAPTTIREEQPAAKATRFERGRRGDNVESTAVVPEDSEDIGVGHSV